MRQYEMFELNFTGAAPMGSAAIVDLSAVFTIGGEEKQVKGFYAGGGCYKVRFLPQTTGTCCWKVDTTLKLSGALEGQEDCLAADEGRHGLVKASGTHFVHEDGTRYVPVGTTVYALIHQEKALVDQTMDTLRKAPFNKIRFCVFPKHYDFNLNEPELFAFEKVDEKWDVDRPCFAFWDMLESRMGELDAMGIEADLILFHPYDHWGFAELSMDECMVYLDYLTRRLSAFPNLWWSLANEYDLMEHFEEDRWFTFAQLIHDQDPYGHLLSNHQCLKLWDFTEKNTTHCCIQGANMIRTPDMLEKYKKPVVFDECCYEGDIPYSWGNISGFELVNRFWTAYTLGAYCSHGETFWNEDEVLWWGKGGVLHGESPERIGFMRSVIEGLPGDLEPENSQFDRKVLREAMADPQRAATIPTVVKCIANLSDAAFTEFMDGNREISGACGDDAFLYYYARHCCRWADIKLPEDKNYRIEVIDVWDMTRETVNTCASGQVRVPLPGKEGMAVLARRI